MSKEEIEKNKPKQIIDLMEKKIVIVALMKDVLSIEDLPNYIRKYIDEYGNDSFINYLSCLLGEPKMDAFLTNCKPLIKDKKKIEEKFGVKITTIKEMKSQMEKNK